MIDIQDELLSGEPRYRVRDSNGNVVDDVSIEMITPVVQKGTSIDKELFTRIINTHLLSGAYNIPVFATQNGSQVLTLPTKTADRYEKNMRVMVDMTLTKTTKTERLLPIFTNYNQQTGLDGFVIIGKQKHNNTTTQAAYNVFDNNYSSGNEFYFGSGEWMGISMPIYVVPRKIRFKIRNGSSSIVPKIEIYGGFRNESAKDASDFKLAELSLPVSTTVDETISINSSTPINKLYFTFSVANGFVYPMELDIVEYDISGYDPNGACSLALQGLEPKTVIDKLNEGLRYELVFDGTVFEAREVVFE